MNTADSKKQKPYFNTITLFLVLFFVPLLSSAQISITEIMYDLPQDSGADGGREWVEIYNSGNEAVDLSTWRFFEADTNHKLTIVEGEAMLPADRYVVIVDKAGAFLTDWPLFSGVLFDSSFSLKNTGEFIAIRNSDLVDIDSVTYSSDWGGKGDGNSLQYVNGKWIAAAPTPGEANAESAPPEGSGEEPQTTAEERTKSSSGESSSTPGSVGSSFPVEPQIFAYAGKNRKVSVSADSLFEGEALGLKREPLLGARYLWNFGDGKTKEGQKILHYYSYPGEYVVVLNVSSGKFSASDRVIVEALPADIIISAIDREFIELENRGDHELNLSWWQLRAGSDFFMIPENTIILPHKKTIFPSLITELTTHNTKNVVLLYPNGVIAYQFTDKEETTVFIPPPPPTQQLATIARVSKTATALSVFTKGDKEESTKVKETKQKPPSSSEISETEQASVLAAAKAVASPKPAGAKRNTSVWLLGLLAVILFAVVTVFAFKRSAKTDAIKIIE